jgi:hypothetical protein
MPNYGDLLRLISPEIQVASIYCNTINFLIPKTTGILRKPVDPHD